jgi:hypothetical protein
VTVARGSTVLERLSDPSGDDLDRLDAGIVE